MPFPAARGPPAAKAAIPADIAAFIASAQQAPDAPQIHEFLASLPARFDGMSPSTRETVLDGIENLAKSRPQSVHLRQALQQLIVRDESEHIEPRVQGIPLNPARRQELLSSTHYADVRWYHHFFGKVPHPEARGVTQGSDLSIHLHVKKDWDRMPSFVAFYRALFAHEYTHRLEFEGKLTEKRGELSAVATEMLRTLELVGLEGLQQDVLGCRTQSELASFEKGRAWMKSKERSQEKGESGIFWKGFAAGVAYEIALQTGRWTDAWLFHRLIASGRSLHDAENTVRHPVNP